MSGPQRPDAPEDDGSVEDDGAGVAAAADRWLPRVAVLETASVLVLLVNRVTVHLDPVTSILGPIHGTLYLATIACGFLSTSVRAAKFLTILPVIGGLLALLYPRLRRRASGTITAAPPRE